MFYMKKLILSFFYIICLYLALDVKSLGIDNMNCQSNNKISDNLQKQQNIIGDYNYTINSYSLTHIQGMVLIGILEKFRPNNICEFGAGESTKIFETYCAKYNKNLLNIEHDNKYKRKDSKLFELKENTSVVINNITYEKTNKYEGLEEFFKNYESKFDLVFIDGPFGFNKEYNYTRIQIIDLLEFDLLENQGYFLIHDSERESAINSINILLKLFKDKGYTLVIEYM